MYSSEEVARYYDNNTAQFLAYGQGGATGSIHRAVWGLGVETRSDAFHFIHKILRDQATQINAKRVLDLGCGTGVGLEYILDGLRAEGFAVTNSTTHAQLARARLGCRASIHELDFCTELLPENIDFAFGIESFVQGLDPKEFFRNISQSLRPLGRLAICDDFLVEDSRHPLVESFQEGWHASSLCRAEALDEIAVSYGLKLVEDRDWTPLLELDRMRDLLIGLFVSVSRPWCGTSIRWKSLSGGHALRKCLKRGLIKYRYRVWEKV